jgi:hypothetical protein
MLLVTSKGRCSIQEGKITTKTHLFLHLFDLASGATIQI